MGRRRQYVLPITTKQFMKLSEVCFLLQVLLFWDTIFMSKIIAFAFCFAGLILQQARLISNLRHVVKYKKFGGYQRAKEDFDSL